MDPMAELAEMRSGQQPQGPMAAPEGEPQQTAAPPQYGSAREQGVAEAPADESQLVPFGPVKLHPALVPVVKGLLQAVPGLSPLDGHRNPKQQKRTNPQETESDHLTGTAVDFYGKAGDLQKGQAWAMQNGGREVILHNSGRGYHLHAAWDPQELEAQAQQQQQAPPPEQPGPPNMAAPPPEAVVA